MLYSYRAFMNDHDLLRSVCVFQHETSLRDSCALQIFDPTVDSRPPTSIQEYDDILQR
jgi:hypothetical protein